MPYIAGEEIFFHETDKFRISYLKWERQGQCVSMSPAINFKVYLRGGVEITINARSDHRARQMAVDIAELFYL